MQMSRGFVCYLQELFEYLITRFTRGIADRKSWVSFLLLFLPPFLTFPILQLLLPSPLALPPSPALPSFPTHPLLSLLPPFQSSLSFPPFLLLSLLPSPVRRKWVRVKKEDNYFDKTSEKRNIRIPTPKRRKKKENEKKEAGG